MFRTGAYPASPHKIAAAVEGGLLQAHVPAAVPPAQVIYPLPPQLSMWLNDTYGDCVTAEEAAAIAAYCMFLGSSEVFISDASVRSFCTQFNVLNGSDLLTVLLDMQKTGLLGPDGTTRYKAGAPSVVNQANEAAVQSAIAANGPLKIGIASSCLPTAAGHSMGWSAFGPATNRGEDHCVALWHYGTASAICQAFGWSLPASVPSGIVYTLYTWKTVGMIDWPWLQSACAEAYTRTPTDVTVQPPQPPQPPSGNKLILTTALPPGTYTIT
jgi:hypothetical protein